MKGSSNVVRSTPYRRSDLRKKMNLGPRANVPGVETISNVQGNRDFATGKGDQISKVKNNQSKDENAVFNVNVLGDGKKLDAEGKKESVKKKDTQVYHLQKKKHVKMQLEKRVFMVTTKC